MNAERSPDSPTLIATTIDCADLAGMTQFWGESLDVEFQIVEPFGFLAHATDRKVTIWLQQVSEETTGKNRMHFDFALGDLAAALERVRSLGGGVGDRREWHDFLWYTCTDPEGNVFGITQGQQA